MLRESVRSQGVIAHHIQRGQTTKADNKTQNTTGIYIIIFQFKQILDQIISILDTFYLRYSHLLNI